jgi:hypothetical protein
MKLLFLSFSSLLASVAAVSATAAAGPVGTTFLYYVWGIGISGLPVFYDNGALSKNLDGPFSLLLELTNPPGAAVLTDYDTAKIKPNLTPVTCRFPVSLSSSILRY